MYNDRAYSQPMRYVFSLRKCNLHGEGQISRQSPPEHPMGILAKECISSRRRGWHNSKSASTLRQKTLQHDGGESWRIRLRHTSGSYSTRPMYIRSAKADLCLGDLQAEEGDRYWRLTPYHLFGVAVGSRSTADLLHNMRRRPFTDLLFLKIVPPCPPGAYVQSCQTVMQNVNHSEKKKRIEKKRKRNTPKMYLYTIFFHSMQIISLNMELELILKKSVQAVGDTLRNCEQFTLYP